MLRAGSGTRERESDAKPEQPTGKPSECVTASSERRADGKYRTPANPLCEAPHGYLQSCHCPGIKPAHKGQYAISESKFRLPYWEENIDQVRVPIVQSVCDTCDHQGTPRLCVLRGRANVQRSCQQARHWRSL